MDFSWLIVAVLLAVIVGVVYLNYLIMKQADDLTTLRTSVNKVVGNLDDVDTMNELKTIVQALQKDPVVSTSSSFVTPTNSTVSSVSKNTAIKSVLNSTYTMTVFMCSITPTTSGATTYVDIPLDPTTSQAYVVAHRGVSNSTLTPSPSGNIVNDIRIVFSADSTNMRVFFTANNSTSSHDISVTILSK